MIKDYICPDVKNEISEDNLRENYDFKKGEDIYRYIKSLNNPSINFLPLGHNILAEALGGNVSFPSNSTTRTGKAICKSLDECLELQNLEKKEFSQMTSEILKAIELLKKDNIKLAIELSGPVGTLDGLVSLSNVFKAFRKDREKIDILFEKISDYTLNFTDLLSNMGVDIISFADPSIGVKIVGEKVLTDLINSYYLSLIKKMSEITYGKSLIHTCPKLYLSFKALGLIKEDTIFFEDEIKYKDALLSLDKKSLTGARCINNLEQNVKSIKIFSLI
ncbi:uroporphyrinogen decarboxylase family protein [Citroniella saccharovorans]|uniref:Uroporphyrinogen decarboxylase family protein n=1 Tax=Citroniella saccharovorans TaxID=2053367 RepID=A0AAW9MWQ5_9FIRM|nr:uroporphyrinogen decarboxylase family protein [Citroniella saccharovorans]